MVGLRATAEADAPRWQASADLGQATCSRAAQGRMAHDQMAGRHGPEWLSSRFARVRVRIAHRDYNLTEARPEEWLLIEWPEGEDEPTKYWLSTLPKEVSFRRLVDTAK